MNQLRLKGYIHQVSSIKKSRVRSFPYFTFKLQVNEFLKQRAVCYDTTKQKLLKAYEESREPVILQKVTQKKSLHHPSEYDVILNKRTRIEKANNNDIPYEYDGTETSTDQHFATIEDIQTLEENELASVKGTLTLRPDAVQQVLMNDGYFIPMLSRCAITDNTGTIRLTLWGATIQEVADNHSYTITDVRVKQYDSTKYLTSTPTSRVTITDEHFPPPTKENFDSLFDTQIIHVDKIRLADNFKTWLSCTKCKKQITDVTSTNIELMKCPNCNVVQPASSCTLSGSVRVAVRHDQKHELIWLKLFAPLLETILHTKSPDLTLQSPEEDIYTELFQLEDFTMDYNEKSSIVKDIHLTP